MPIPAEPITIYPTDTFDKDRRLQETSTKIILHFFEQEKTRKTKNT
jgi:hypothetical protein